MVVCHSREGKKRKFSNLVIRRSGSFYLAIFPTQNMKESRLTIEVPSNESSTDSSIWISRLVEMTCENLLLMGTLILFLNSTSRGIRQRNTQSQPLITSSWNLLSSAYSIPRTEANQAPPITSGTREALRMRWMELCAHSVPTWLTYGQRVVREWLSVAIHEERYLLPFQKATGTERLSSWPKVTEFSHALEQGILCCTYWG